MPRSIGEPNSIAKDRDLKVRIPTIDELMRPLQPRPWWEFLPPPALPNDNPFAPVPITPPLPPPPIEVDPPSRPPEWLFGPPRITGAPPQSSSSGPQYAPPIRPVSAPAQEKPGGLLGMMAEAGLIDPSNPDRPPPGGLLGLMQEYLRNNKDSVVGG